MILKPLYIFGSFSQITVTAPYLYLILLDTRPNLLPLLLLLSRDGILKVIQSAPKADLVLPPCDTHRCPLGRCLMKNEVCNNVPQCADFSDEYRPDCDQINPMCNKVR